MDCLTVAAVLILPAAYLIDRRIAPHFRAIVWLFYGLLLLFLVFGLWQ